MNYFKPLILKPYRTHCINCNHPIKMNNKSGYCSNCGNRNRQLYLKNETKINKSRKQSI